MKLAIIFLNFLLLTSLFPEKQVIISLNEQKMSQAGLINVKTLDESILVNLKYATTDNFLKENVYGELKSCFLLKETAQMLVNAQKNLKRINPEYNLLIYDCARPRKIQYQMWDLVKNTPQQGYVANPAKGSVHNYGAAVDLTIADGKKKPLDMGTAFDFFGSLAEPRYENQFLKEGKLALKQIENRRLLRKVMTQAGFMSISNEWWHFDSLPREILKTKYKIIE